jgi:hypothetical protein
VCQHRGLVTYFGSRAYFKQPRKPDAAFAEKIGSLPRPSDTNTKALHFTLLNLKPQVSRIQTFHRFQPYMVAFSSPLPISCHRGQSATASVSSGATEARAYTIEPQHSPLHASSSLTAAFGSELHFTFYLCTTKQPRSYHLLSGTANPLQGKFKATSSI